MPCRFTKLWTNVTMYVAAMIHTYFTGTTSGLGRWQAIHMSSTIRHQLGSSLYLQLLRTAISVERARHIKAVATTISSPCKVPQVAGILMAGGLIARMLLHRKPAKLIGLSSGTSVCGPALLALRRIVTKAAGGE